MLLDPIVFLAEFKHAAEAGRRGQESQAVRAGVGPTRRSTWARSLEFSLGREVTPSIIKKLTLFGIEFGANAGRLRTDQHSDQRIQQPAPVHPRAGMRCRRPSPSRASRTHSRRRRWAASSQTVISTNRALIQASDNCDRPVQLDSQPIGTRFWPVGKTTTMQWCGRDLGPTHANGGSNRTCADLQITVEDTLPPLVMAPPAINLITSDTQAPALGRPGLRPC
ncbi:MAG: hypothetical protein U5K38_05670 [Woeseiaceae bacterium]|nr:hypothetical protein [Woeseiaceae bacterium]